MRIPAFILFILSFHISFHSIAQKEFVTEDKIYDNNIRTAILYPAGKPLNPPVIPMGQNNLVLEFDELVTEFKTYNAKIINCEADWKVSSLNSIQYLKDYNEFNIVERSISVNTRTPYIHYKFSVPAITMSGNYILKIYRDYNEDDIVITKRFMVFENIAAINPVVRFSADPSARNTHQQIDFSIDYSKMDIINPGQSIKVILRKNFRWDQSISDLYPVSINQDIRQLEYFYFNRENNFPGGNEYRIFDIRSALNPGINVFKVKRDGERAEMQLYPDKGRAWESYSQPLVADFDGRFYIENLETGDREIMADYVYTRFTLESPAVDGKVYVFGALSNWKIEKEFEMTYDRNTNQYTCEAFLKQGVYNYQYVKVNPKTGAIDEIFFEGTHSVTQNNYDILVYYRGFGARSDQLIGYRSINYLPRR
jgi:hypothetical protein